MKLRSIALGSIASVALMAGSALAADLPVRGPAPAPVFVTPVFSWSGFYIGLNAGGAWSSGCTNYSLLYNVTPASNWPSTCADGDSGQFTGGAQIGYNFQAGSIVYGIEADINGVGNSNSSSRSFYHDGLIPGAYRVTGLGDPGLFGTVRARLGIAADRALFYVTGGLAWADGGNDPTISFWNAPTATGPADITWRRGGASGIGWTLGAGIEYAIANNWTIRAEYLYVDLGKEDNAWSCTTSIGIGCERFTWVGRADVNFNVVRVGVNYKFGGAAYAAPVVARY